MAGVCSMSYVFSVNLIETLIRWMNYTRDELFVPFCYLEVCKIWLINIYLTDFYYQEKKVSFYCGKWMNNLKYLPVGQISSTISVTFSIQEF